MSRSIDERVVSMQFDNARFEKNVATSMSTLEKLKHALKLDGASKGFEDINSAAGKVNMSPLGSAVESVGMKFSAMEVVAVTALANITNSAINTGKRLIASLSTDQIAAGWEKFGSKTTSVATLVSQGNALETVNEQLDRLNWFTDETSYNFTDMVSNIAKFTATGKGLEESVTAMEGIANWAALSGQNASTASRAMYQISQAMGAGVMRLEDYKSIQNASMDTDEFRQKCLDAAVALGTLEVQADGTYKSLVGGGDAFSKTQFTTQLTEGAWLTSDVMMKVFGNYSDAVNAIYEVTEEKRMLASEVLDQIHERADELKTGTMTDEEAIDAAIKDLGYTLEDGSLMFDSFGVKAFEAAQKARTWGDAVDSVKDAVSTGWMNTFEIIFGNAEEATELWTDLANAMYDVFAGGAEARNEMLQEWKDLGGRDDLIESFWNVWEGIASIVTPIKEAFRDIFPAMTAERLAEITAKLKELTAKFKLSDEQAAKLKSTFKGLFAVLDIVWTVFKTLVSGAFKIVGAFGKLAGGVLGATGSLGDFLSNIRDSIKETNIFGKAVDAVVGFVTKAVDKIREFGKSLKSGVDTSGFSGILGFFKGLWSFITKVAKAIISTLGDLGGAISEAVGKGDIFEVLNSGVLVGILVGVKKITSGFGDALENIGGITDKITKILDSVRGCFKAYQQELKAKALLKIAEAIAILAASLFVISTIDSDKLASATVAIGALFGMLIGMMSFLNKASSSTEKVTGKAGLFETLSNSLSTLTQSLKQSMMTSSLIKLSVAVLIMAGAMKILAGLDWNGIAKGLVGIAALVAILVTAAKIMNSEYKTITKFAGQMILMSIAIGMLSLVAKSFASISWEGLTKAGLGITGAVVLLVAAAKIMDSEYKSITKFAGQMLIMSAAIGVVSLAAKSFASMSWGGLAKACIGLTVAVGLLVAAAKIMDSEYKSITKFAGQMLIMSVGITILASAMKKLGSMSWGGIAKSLIAIAGAFAIIGVAALLLEPLIGTILALSAAFVLFGIGMVGIGAGITLIAVGIGALATAISVGATAIVAGLTVIVTGILNLVPTIIQIIGKTIVGIATVIGEQAPTLAASCLKLVTSVLKSLAEEAPQITDSLAELLIGIINSLSTHMPALIEAFLNLLASVFDGLGKVLKNLDFGSLRDGITAASGLAALMLAMSVALKIASKIKIKDAVKGALALTTMIVPLAAFVGVLALMNGVEVATKTVIALAALAAACSLMLIPLSLVGSIGLGAALKGVVALTAMALPMLAFVGVLALMDGVENATTNVKALTTLATACTLLLIPLTLIGAIVAATGGTGALAIVAGVLALTAMAVPMLTFVGVLAIMSNVKNAENNAKLLTDLMTVMGDLLFKISLVAPLAVVGVAAMSGLTLLIGAVAVMATAMGALMEKFPSLENFLNKGLPILEQLAGSIGTMIGKFIGGIGEALSASLIGIGENIAKFMDKLAEASDNAEGINPDAFDGVEKLMEVMLKIGGTSIGTGIMDLVSGLFNFGDDSMDTFKKNGVAFFKAMKEIGEASSEVDINAEAVDGILTVAERMADLQSKLEPIGGVVSWFSGRDDLGTFGLSVASFIYSMKIAFAQLNDTRFNTEAMNAVVSASTSLAELQNSLEPIGGVVTWFKGRDDLGTFGLNVASFVYSMKLAFSQLKDAEFNTEAMDAMVSAATSLAELQSNLEPIGGVVTWFTGRDDLGTFGLNVASFVHSMKIAFAQLDDVKFNTAAMDAIVSAATSLGKLQSNLQSVGGVVDWFTGRDDLGTFGKNVASFISSMKTAFDELDGAEFNAESMNTMVSAATSLAELQSKLQSVGGVVDWFTGRDDLGTFGENIGKFAEAMKKLKEGMGENGIPETVITSVTNSGNAIIALQNALPEEHWFDGKMNLSEFSDYITDFSDAMSMFGAKASEIDSGAVSTVISTAYRLKSLIESLVGLDTSGVKAFTGIGTGGWGADGPAYDIARAMSAYSDEVAGIDTTAVSVSASAAQTLRSLIASLVGLDSSGVENFRPDSIGSKMKSYAEKVAGINVVAVSSSISAANRLKTFISSLAGLDTSGVANFKPDLIGSAIKTYATSVSGINTQSVSNSITSANRLRSFISSLTSLNISGVNSFTDAVKKLSTVDINGLVKAFSGASAKLSTAGIDMIDGLIRGMQSRLPAVMPVVTALLSKLSSGIKSKISVFKDAGEAIVSKLAAGISSKKNTMSTSITSCLTTAVSTIRGKYNSFYSAGSYLVTGFANGISENSYKAAAKAKAMAEAAVKAAREALKINSPSKVFKEIGSGVPEGFAMGIGMLGGEVKRSVGDMASTAITSTRSVMTTILDALNADMDTQPTIRPVVDLSDVQTGAAAVNGMFDGIQTVGARSNLSAINATMNAKLQNGVNDDVVSAINKLRGKLDNIGNTSYTINGITYDDGSAVSDAMETLIRYAKIGRRV